MQTYTNQRSFMQPKRHGAESQETWVQTTSAVNSVCNWTISPSLGSSALMYEYGYLIGQMSGFPNLPCGIPGVYRALSGPIEVNMEGRKTVRAKVTSLLPTVNRWTRQYLRCLLAQTLGKFACLMTALGTFAQPSLQFIGI